MACQGLQLVQAILVQTNLNCDSLLSDLEFFSSLVSLTPKFTVILTLTVTVTPNK
jgi:hypothetical protein